MPLMRERLGIFSGFGDSRHEIQSTVLIPYHQSRMPLQGAFLIVGMDDLHGRPSGILGRVTRAMPIGDLFTPAGEDYLVDLVRLQHEVPEEVKQGRLRYRINLRLLGQMSEDGTGGFVYTPAIRQVPHVGASVGFPTDDVTRFIARGCANSTDDPGPVIGHLAVGDLAFDGSERARRRAITVHFRMDSLVGRRTAVFARAGLGKSNFTKVLLTRLYEGRSAGTPGTLIIDPEGEYAFANASEPGLLDVPALRDRIVVYTQRAEIEPKYRHAIVGDCRINLVHIEPTDAVNTLLPEEKQNMVFANQLRSLAKEDWAKLVGLVSKHGYRTNHGELGRIMGRRPPRESEGADVVVGAVINNLVPAIQRLHSDKSMLMRSALESLREGKIVILDASMLTGTDAKLVASWLLRSLFANNQEFYTIGNRPTAKGEAKRGLIPCLAVFEEAQFYLGGRVLDEDSPFVRWFKEGRKFSLGSMLVTQQPGAISESLISQCDNFFAFHLLSRGDLDALAHANLHYDGDIAMSIGHEPIPGNCYLWSSRGLAFVTCARILHFGKLVEDSLEPVAARPTKREEEVVLPVSPIRLGRTEIAKILRTAIETAICSKESVHLFKVENADGSIAKNRVAAVSSFLLNAVKEILSLREDSVEFQKAVTLDNETLLKFAKTLSRHGWSAGRDHQYQYIVVNVEGLNLERKVSRNAVRLKEM